MKNKYHQMIRGICILMVILIHTLYFTNVPVYDYTSIIIRRIINFGTATFIFLAGYFTKNINTKKFYLKKAKRLLIPLLIWNTIYMVFSSPWKESKTLIIKKFILLKFTPHLYYLYVLASLFLIAKLLTKYIAKEMNFKKVFIPLIITPLYNLFLTLYQIKTHSQFPLFNYWIFGWISYYYLGLLIQKNEKIINFNFKKSYALTLLVFSLIEGILIYLKYNIYSLATSQLTLSNSFYSMYICILLIKNQKKNVKNNILVKIGDYSFGIYLNHMIVIRVAKKIIIQFSQNYFIIITLVFIITLVTSYIINKAYYEIIKKTA